MLDLATAVRVIIRSKSRIFTGGRPVVLELNTPVPKLLRWADKFGLCLLCLFDNGCHHGGVIRYVEAVWLLILLRHPPSL